MITTDHRQVWQMLCEDDRIGRYERRLAALRESDRYAVRCGFEYPGRDYVKAKMELRNRRKAKRGMR